MRIRTVYIAMLGALTLVLAAAGEESAPRIPPAFPEGREWSQEAAPGRAAPLPLALPPGVSQPDASAVEMRATPPADANWIVKRMAESDDAAVRKRASEMWPVAETVMEDMDVFIHALADPSEEVRAGALERLKKMDSAEVFGYVMRIMVGGALEQVRAVDKALPAMDGILTSFMMETLRTDLETLLHRRIAAYCLGRMSAVSAVDVLGEYSWSDDDTLARACVDALYAIGAPQSMPHWMALLDHHDPYHRHLAVHALAALGGPNSFERLKRLILSGTEDPTLQSAALRALGQHPPDMLFPLLVEALGTNRALRSTALRMLREQAGVDFGWDMSAWREWLQAQLHEAPSPIVPGQ